MPHVFPKRPVSSTAVMNIEDFNENMMAVAQEAGRLNEHNMKDGCHSASPLYVQAGAAIMLDSEFDAVNPEGDYETFPPDPPVGTDMISLEENNFWTPILEKQIVTHNSPLWIIFSLQYCCHPDDYPDTGGAQFAVAIDGTILAESITGSLDMDNLYAADLAHAYSSPVGGPLLPNKAYGCPISGDLVVPIPAGAHTISLLGKQLVSRDAVNPSSANVYSRELIVIELRR